MKLLGILTAMSLGLAACVGPNQTLGTVGGAAAGGLIGSQIGQGDGRLVATGVGTLLGAAIGNSWGSSVDRQNQMYQSQQYQPQYQQPQYIPQYPQYQPYPQGYDPYPSRDPFIQCRIVTRMVQTGWNHWMQVNDRMCRGQDGQWYPQ